MGIKGLAKFIYKSDIKRILIFLVTVLTIYSILVTSVATKRYNLKEGEIAKVSIKAQREVKDEISTEARIQQAVNAVLPQFIKKSEIKEEVIDNINTLFSKTIQLRESNIDDTAKLLNIKNNSKVKISDEDFKALINLSKEDLKTAQNLQGFLVKTLSQLFDTSIEDNVDGSGDINQESLRKAQESILLSFNGSSFSKTVRELGVVIANSQIEPNSVYDINKTEELKKDTIKKVPPVMIKKDQIIVKEGEPVTKYQIEILKNLGLLDTHNKYDFAIYISLCGLIILVLSLQWIYLYKYYNKIYIDYKKLILISLLISISLLLTKTISILSPFLIPLAFMPMLLTLLINYKVSLIISVVNCVLVSTAVGFNTEITLIAVLNSAIGAIILKKMQQRNDILYASIYIAIVNFVMSFSVGFLLSNNILEISKNAGFSLVASGISGVFTIGFLPFLESSFGIVTNIKLLELSNANNPLLKKLLMEAPGTYHHSILVANLAEMAAQEVGANPVLARVASYYHDVGKIKRPYFFKENQLGRDNPHDKITPNLSALIITSHIKDGLEFAKEYKLPKVLQDVIEQHHGDSLVKYFYITMKNSSENPEDVDVEDFKYPGPIPISKESGIIMLADGVEASVRSISEPTNEKIKEMVNNIIKDRLMEGQLDNCDLTLKDLDKIKKAFLNALSGIYHERIEYPTDKWSNKI